WHSDAPRGRRTVVSRATIQRGGPGSVTVTGGNPSATGTIASITVDPSNRDTAYLTFSYPNSLAGPVVLRTTNAGQTWADVTGSAAVPGDSPLPALAAWTAAVDPRDDTLYVGNGNGVWRLQDAS